ncbi:MAG: DUF1156 domain-containing protein [Ardenticatenaceae bacterium]|nr:DUF1156 domain-containing protein [Ardenticatenaceae bacterium]
MPILTKQKTFIEAQFPVSKVSKESYKERKANYSQTLTGLGKWWGRKPLVLVRATLIGLLMPVSDDPKKDREIFLKIMTMDDDGLLRRRKSTIQYKKVYELLTEQEHERYFQPLEVDKRPQLKQGTREEKQQMRDEVQALAFQRLSYDDKLQYCYRPEEIDGPSTEAWEEINAHLNTDASNLQELVQQLGERQFGHTPKVGDAFAGGGNIPFEAARLGCQVFASDLNPVATLLTWASLNIVGGGKEVLERVEAAQKKVYEAVDKQITEWGIEHNEQGWRANAYLYCVETRCPDCGVMVPLLPFMVIGKGTHTIAKLKFNQAKNRYDIQIEEGVSNKDLAEAEKKSTLGTDGLICPSCHKSNSLQGIRGDKREGNDTDYGLRLWSYEDIIPLPNDVFQERLYCVRWIETFEDKKGKIQTRRIYRSVTEQDEDREERVKKLLQERIKDWQNIGYIPSMQIEPGDETTRLRRERGWTYWHHLFNPRQLLTIGSLFEKSVEISNVPSDRVACLLGAARAADYNARLSRWHPHGANEKSEQVFSNQALNTLFNYGCRPLTSLSNAFFLNIPAEEARTDSKIVPGDARTIDQEVDIWITDPPYADAVNYHELSEFFLAWYAKSLTQIFPEWYTDSKRALAITGSEEGFRRAMVESYSNLAKHMPDTGLQVVMFTHQDVSVWADLALILWASGLKVAGAWTIATETDTALKEGNYVQGTVILILRKRLDSQVAFEDEINFLVEEEVRAQLNSMQALDQDEDEPSFGDTDYQLAAYAAALRVLTQYSGIEEWNIERELMRPRQDSKPSPIENVINQAVKIAADHLIPKGFDDFVWKTLTAAERLYLKGLELEAHDEFRTGAYQEMARGFGVRDYRDLFASAQANKSRFKNATEFGTKMLGGEGFESSYVRHALFATREAVRTEDAQQGRNWLKNELPDYWDQRKKLIEILRYLSRMSRDSEHWEEDGKAARLVAAAVEHDHT